MRTREQEEERSGGHFPEGDRQPARGSVGVGVGVCWVALSLLYLAIAALGTLALIDLAIRFWGKR